MKQYADRRKSNLMVLVALLAMVFSGLTVYHVVSAQGTLLTATGKGVYVGDTVQITDFFSDEPVENIKYGISENSENRECITMSATGQITALEAGSAIVTIEYTQKDALQVSTESFYVAVYAPQVETLSYGAVLELDAYGVYPPGEEYVYQVSNDSLFLTEYGSVQVQGFQGGTVTVKEGQKEITVAEITVEQPRLASEEEVARAIGTEPWENAVENFTPISQGDTEEGLVWSPEDERVAVASGGAVTALSVGSTNIQVTVTAKNKDTVKLRYPFTVTDPKLTKDMLVTASGRNLALPVSGLASASTLEQKEGNKEYAYLSGKKIVAVDKGTMDMRMIVDGRELSIRIVVTDPKCKNIAVPMYKGLAKQLSITGLNKTYSTVSYSSEDKSIATISGKGEIKAKKTGSVKMTIKADGRTITVWAQVGAKKAYQASRKEIKISKQKTQYSQTRRMQKGYYDCSSLVSRVYRQYGVYFGRKKGWAPTAADIGKWCSSNKKVVARKGVKYTKLLPGDLLLYSYSGNNGRYLNIDHVDMYVGDGMCVSASSSNNKVVKTWYYPGSVVLVARPIR